MIDHVVRQATMLGWFSAAATANSTACAAIREKDDTYEFEPQTTRTDLQEAIARLGEGVSLTMASQITESIFKLLPANSVYLPTNSSGGRIPIVESLEHVDTYLVQSSRACIVRNEGFVLVWSDQVGKIIEIGQDVQREFLSIVRQIDCMYTCRSLTQFRYLARNSHDQSPPLDFREAHGVVQHILRHKLQPTQTRLYPELAVLSVVAI